VMTDLGTLGGFASFANAINGLGDVVGWVSAVDGTHRAFLYADGLMTDLNALIPAGSGWVLHEGRAINDARQIAAIGARGGTGDHALLLTPSSAVPTTTTTTSTTPNTTPETTTTTVDGTTTSTTGPPPTSSTTATSVTTTSTTTTTLAPQCQVGLFGPALCEVAQLSATGICAPDSLDPRLQRFIVANVGTVRGLLHRAELQGAKGRLRQARSLAKAATGRLSAISRKVARAAQEGRGRPAKISAACRRVLDQVVGVAQREISG